MMMLSDEHGFIPTQAVAEQAAKGLRFKNQFGRGGTKIGWARARGLAARHPVASRDIVRIISYFARHEVDKKAENFGNELNPSNGYIAWLLWGGDEGRAWALSVRDQLSTAKKT